MNKYNFKKKGFTLLELLIVIAILAIIATISQDFFGSYLTGSQVNDSAETIIYDLRNTRDKAMNGQDDRNWGIHFVNGITDYYQVYSTPTDYNDIAKTVVVTVYLKGGVVFSNPSDGNNSDIIFTKISGAVASSSVAVKNGTTEKIVTVQAQGLIN